MKTASFFERVRAAQAVANAVMDGVAPNTKHLKTLGLPADLAARFKR